jgi:signal transduction histidine kinase
VSRAVGDAVERFRAMIAPDEMRFSSSIETRVPVRHDASALNAVVLNLLTNAYKYTGKDKRIALRARDENGGVAIEVRDNGVGLSPAEVKSIFQPFYRARRQGEGDTGGVGLGLAIARYLVERHGGTITVESEKSKGSAFTIRLPAASDVP